MLAGVLVYNASSISSTNESSLFICLVFLWSKYITMGNNNECLTAINSSACAPIDQVRLHLSLLKTCLVDTCTQVKWSAFLM